jgi:hypothetical protein
MMVAAATLVIVTVCSAGITVWNLHEQIDGEARANLGRIALVIAEQTSRTLESVDLLLTEVEGRMVMDGLNTEASVQSWMGTPSAHQFLKDRVQSLPQVDNLNLVGSDGWVINNTRSWPTPSVSIAHREQFKFLRDNNDGKLFVSEPMRSQVNGSWTIYLARRLNDSTGRFLGLVSAAVRLKHFEDLYTTINLGTGSAVTLVRRDGVLLARFPRMEDRIGASIGPHNMRAALGKHLDGETFLMGGGDGHHSALCGPAIDSRRAVDVVGLAD